LKPTLYCATNFDIVTELMVKHSAYGCHCYTSPPVKWTIDRNLSLPLPWASHTSNPQITQLAAYFLFSFIRQWLYSPLLGLGRFFSFLIFFTQTVGLFGWVISPMQGRYLHTEQDKHRINAHTDIHALNGIRTHNPSVRASKEIHALDWAATVIGSLIA
jgi:hypothetical protein